MNSTTPLSAGITSSGICRKGGSSTTVPAPILLAQFTQTTTRWSPTSGSGNSGPFVPITPPPHRPDLSQLQGPTAAAEARRQAWTQEVEHRLRMLEPLDSVADPNGVWQQLCTTCREVAAEICGVLQHGKGAPWLRHRDNEVRALDRAITQVKQADSAAQEQGTHEEWRRAFQLARRTKQQTLQEWETDWLSRKAAEANAALASRTSSN